MKFELLKDRIPRQEPQVQVPRLAIAAGVPGPQNPGHSFIRAVWAGREGKSAELGHRNPAFEELLFS